MNDRLVTVYVTTYNRPHFLFDCLQSIRNQTFRDFHVVVLDDASTEDYSFVIREFEKDGFEFRRHDRNIGGMNNLRYGLSAPGASSEYVMVFHDDDLMHPRLLEIELDVLTNDPALRFVATESERFIDFRLPGSSRVRPPRPPLVFDNPSQLAVELAKGSPLTLSSVVYRTEVLKNTSLRVEEYGLNADHPFYLEIARQGPCALIPEDLVVHRRTSFQLTSIVEDLNDRQLVAFYKAYRSAMMTEWNERAAWHLYSMTGIEAIPAYKVLAPTNRGSSMIDFLRRLRKAGVLRYPFLLLYLYRPVRRWMRRIPRFAARLMGARIDPEGHSVRHSFSVTERA